VGYKASKAYLRSIGQIWGLDHKSDDSTWSLPGKKAHVCSLGWGMRDLEIVCASVIIDPCAPSSSRFSVELIVVSNQFYRVQP
jgi:hypothetical protein